MLAPVKALRGAEPPFHFIVYDRIAVDPSGEGDSLTTWTKLADLERGLYYVRTSEALNYTRFDIKALADVKDVRVAPLARFNDAANAGTGILLTRAEQ